MAEISQLREIMAQQRLEIDLLKRWIDYHECRIAGQKDIFDFHRHTGTTLRVNNHNYIQPCEFPE